jgi:hypothetical protein
MGDRRVWMGTVTFDSAYPTGGETLVAADLGFTEIDFVVIDDNPASSRIAVWDPATGKLKLFTALSTEAGNGTDQSTIICPLLVIGK